MMNMYLQIFLRLNLIVLFLLLIRKMIGKRLRKKFVYGLWIVVPAFLLSFPFVRLPRLFHWEVNMGKLFQLEGKNVEPQDVVTSITGKKLEEPTQEKKMNSDERLTPNEFLNEYEVPDLNEVPDQNDNLNWNEAWHQSTDSEWNEISYQNEEAIGNKAPIEKGNQDENPLQNGISEEKAETVKTQVQPATNTTTPAKGMKLSTVLGAVYLLMVAALLLYMILSNVLFHISCRKKRIYLRKSEGVGLAVYHLEGITSPFLMGKTIYLPSYMVEEEQIRYAILHEESHYLHGDAFWVIVRYIVLAIYFYDPVIWLAFFASGRDCELACDEAVLGKISEEEGSAYGACLLKSVEQKLHKNRRMVMTTNMSTDKKFMKERIVNIMNRKKKSRITMALAIAIMMVVTGCAYEKQNVDTSKQESLTSEMEETTEGNEPESAEETEGKSESQEESVETMIEVSNIDEDVRVTENDEVADNTEESNNVSEDDFTVSNVDAKGTIQSVDSMITVDEVRDPIFKGKNIDYSMILMDIRYPKLTDFSDNSGSTMNTIIDCVNKQCKDAADDYISDFEKMARDEYEDKTDWEDGAYFYNAGGYLRRVDGKVFSMVEGITSYAHGAHECYNFDTFNYDVATGKEITLENLVSDKEALYNAIKKELSEKYDASLFLEEDTLTETLHDYVCDAAYGGLKFSIEKDGVSFWFGNYDLTAYVYGCQMVTVPFKENEGLFNKEYVTTEEDYVKTVVPGVDYKLSSGHSFSVLEGYDQYDYVVLDIAYDNVSNKVKEIEGYDNQQTYLVHKSGKDYLYCQARGYSEDDELLIYALGGAQLGTPKHPAEAVKLGCAMIDPKKVNMYLRVDVLSTMNIMKEFYIGEDGMPMTDQAYYELGETGNELTLLRDLTAEVAANENSDAYTSEVLKAGTKMKIYRTNGKDLIDLILNDGRIVRLHIDFSQYPHKINGTEVDEFEFFDGIAYCD